MQLLDDVIRMQQLQTTQQQAQYLKQQQEAQALLAPTPMIEEPSQEAFEEGVKEEEEGEDEDEQEEMKDS